MRAQVKAGDSWRQRGGSQIRARKDLGGIQDIARTAIAALCQRRFLCVCLMDISLFLADSLSFFFFFGCVQIYMHSEELIT